MQLEFGRAHRDRPALADDLADDLADAVPAFMRAHGLLAA
jgi:hypothetical protein